MKDIQHLPVIFGRMESGDCRCNSHEYDSGNEISINEFSKDEETGAVIISKNGVNLFIKTREKLQSNMNYLEYLEHPVSCRAIWWQVSKIVKCIDNGNFDDYMPIRIR